MSATIHPALGRGRRLPNVWDVAALLCVVGVLIGGGARGARHVRADRRAARRWRSTSTRRTCRNTRCAPRCACSPPWSPRCCSPSPTPPLAAKSRRAGLILVPILDILQSVPILGFLTFTVAFFMSLFPGQVLGLELAAIFAIFTSQAWNMAFSFYQSLSTVPADLDEASRSFHLTAWQRFWRLEVPFAMPGPGLEHHDVDVRRLVLRRRVARRSRSATTPGSCRASAPTSRWRWSSATSARCSGRSSPCWW